MTDLIKIYPFNLALQIFGHTDAVQRVYLPNIPVILEILTDREYEIIKQRSDEKKTYQEIADFHKVTRTRIRQIHDNALLKLKKPLQMQLITAVSEKECSDRMRQTNEGLPNIVKLPNTTTTTTIDSSIEHLNLSARCCRSLHRADKTTIRDLTGISYAELIKMPSISHITAEEIRTSLVKAGFALHD